MTPNLKIPDLKMPDAKVQGDPEVRKKLGLEAPPAGRRWLVRVVVILLLAGAIAGGVTWWLRFHKPAVPDYVTEAVKRGDLEVTVTATGSLDAVETVDVGAEVSGRILKVHVDFNDTVEKGQLLAELDTEQLGSRLAEAQAQVRSAHAAERAARASAKEATQTAKRSQELAAKGLISQQALESAMATADRAQAEIGTASAQAAIADAGLKEAQNALSKADIRSPISGIVLSRNVQPGQTLASSFQVPVLFKIARDLRDMELRISIDEADVGRIQEGQPASFTVDAYPNRKFSSKVVSLHNVPILDQNVVTYQAVLSVDNEARLLRPGMTATATVITEHISDVVLVPNAALRFTPPEEVIKEQRIKDSGRRIEVKDDDRPKQRVWVLEGAMTRALELDVGATDGHHSELTEGELPEGTELIVDLRVPEEKP